MQLDGHHAWCAAECSSPPGQFAKPDECHRRYDDGLQDITNVDFVEAVVRDMMRRNLRQRPRMKWFVQDMTRMDKVHTLRDCMRRCIAMLLHAACEMPAAVQPNICSTAQLGLALQFAEGSFDVAFDKGGLDALMGDEGDDADAAGVPVDFF